LSGCDVDRDDRCSAPGSSKRRVAAARGDIEHRIPGDTPAVSMSRSEVGSKTADQNE
jgi:hypothetical protein